MKVHRGSFVEWTPAGITALAQSPSGHFLAVGRSSGSIELWDLRHWILVKKIPGGEGLQVSTIDFVDEDHVVTGSISDSNLIVWNINLGRPVSTADAYGGGVWQVAMSPDRTTLAVAADDGRLRFYDVSELDGELNLVFVRSFFHHKGRKDRGSRVLSVAWSSDGEWVATGGADAGAVISSPTTGRVEHIMRMECLGKTNANVWRVKFAGKGVLVTADSTGTTSFWCTRTGTHLQGFKQHAADVTKLAVCARSPSATGKKAGQEVASHTVFASGMDPRVIAFDIFGDSNVSSGHGHTAHTHDTTALLALRGGNLVVSGSSGGHMAVYSTSKFARVRPVPVLSYPQGFPSLVSVVPGARLVSAALGSQLQLYSLGEASDDKKLEGSMNSARLALEDAASHALEVNAPDGLEIASHAVSGDGRFVCLSTADRLSLFELQPAGVFPVTIADPAEGVPVPPATVMAFTPSGSHLVLGTADGSVVVVDTETGCVVTAFRQGCRVLPRESYGAEVESRECDGASVLFDNSHLGAPTVRQLSVSSCGKLIGAADACGHVLVYNLEKATLQTVLPTFPEPITAMAFSLEGQCPEVAVASGSFKLEVYNSQSGQPSLWTVVCSKRLSANKFGGGNSGMASTLQLPRSQTALTISGMFFLAPSGTESEKLPSLRSGRVAMVSRGALVVVDLDQELAAESEVVWYPGSLPKPKRTPGFLKNKMIVAAAKEAHEARVQSGKSVEKVSKTAASAGVEKFMGSGSFCLGSTSGKKAGSGKRKLSSPAVRAPAVTVISRFSGILGAGTIEGGDLVVLERPWLALLDSSPSEVLSKKRYGSA